MSALLRDRVTLVWAGLVAATASTWILGTDHGLDDAQAAGVVILLITFLKVRFVGRWFMELRDAPVVLAALFDGWVAIVCGVVTVMYVVGS